MNYEVYKTLTSAQKEEYDYRFRTFFESLVSRISSFLIILLMYFLIILTTISISLFMFNNAAFTKTQILDLLVDIFMFSKLFMFIFVVGLTYENILLLIKGIQYKKFLERCNIKLTMFGGFKNE